MTAPPPCTGCAFAQRRYRLSKPALHCLRFHIPAICRCNDYRRREQPSPAAPRKETRHA